MVGKNAQQIRAMVLRQVKAYKALLNTFCTNARAEAAFMVHLQARRLPYACGACTASLSQCALGRASPFKSRALAQGLQVPGG